MKNFVRKLGWTVCCAMPLCAQQAAPKAMGSVATADAKVSGGLEVSEARARLLSNVSVTAYDRTAQIDLERGGLVAVCATSAFHLLRSGTGDALLFALDRGALEIRSRVLPQDAIVTPDLRLTMLSQGTFDLRLRVTREGDTCIENRGAGAPVIQVADGFSAATYHVAPGQHVLFEHGSVGEVVDNERSSCGCPSAAPVMTAAGTANATSVPTSQQVEAMHPFPAAQSQGLGEVKPSVPLPAATASETATLAYAGPESAKPAVVASAPVGTVQGETNGAGSGPVAPPASPPGAKDIAHRIGRFFKRLFGGK